MQTKLTLRINAQAIARAKEWAHIHHTSLSHIVEDYFKQLSAQEKTKQTRATLDDWTKSLIGIIPQQKLGDKKLKQRRMKHLSEKYS